MRNSRLAAAALAAAALLASSCGPSRKPVFPVRGQVFDDKHKPAVGALIIFHPVGGADADAAKPVGHVDDSGAFTLTTYKQGDGAPAGEYAVTIEWPAPKTSPFGGEGKDQLKGRYRDPNASKIRFTVENKPDNEVPAIEVR
jgi:hypothetical protein